MILEKTLAVVPSLLAGDLSRLGEQLDQVKAAGCHWISVDVMDGHFVPNLSFGPDFVKLAKKKGFYVDTHLMVTNPLQVAPWFVEAGTDILTAHIEVLENPREAMKAIRKLGVKSGLAVKPKTPVNGLLASLEAVDLALVMTVEPGFGGQKFMADQMPKVEALRRKIDAEKFDCWIQVDGGVNAANIATCSAAGADSLVAGSAVFAAKDPAAAFRELEKNARAALKS